MNKLYSYPFGRWLIHRVGGSVWRLPRVLRRRMCHGGAAGVARLPGTRRWVYRGPEQVIPLKLQEYPTLGHRLSSRPFRLPAAVVCQVPRAWLVGTHAAAVTDRGRLLMGAFRDSARILGLEPNQDLVHWLETRGWEASDGQTPWTDVCPLVNRLDTNYYHWMVESCGQLQGLEHYTAETGIEPKILIRGGGPSYLRESLELLGMKPERIVQWKSENGPRRVERLVIPARPGNEVACSPASLRWLRERFFQGAGVDLQKSQAIRRLYIPRKKGGWRAVLNEDEVIVALEKIGFEIVRPEGLDLAAQIRLFAQAEMIVGLHGAGLANLLFAPRACIVELTGTYGGGDYYSMASALGNLYRALPCVQIRDDVTVDVTALKKVVLETKRSSQLKPLVAA